MSFHKISKLLVGDTPGRSTELNYYRIGPAGAAKKVYLQAALHADEQLANWSGAVATTLAEDNIGGSFVELGDWVEKGDRIADLIQLDGDGAFVTRTPLLAGTTGQVISRKITKYVWANANVSKIVGSEILESRSGNLLSD